MLQSSIYPDSFTVPKEYFFIIKVQFELPASAPQTLIIKRLILNIQDKVKSRGKEEFEFVNVEIEKKIIGKDNGLNK